MSGCRKATELASQEMDRPLRLSERLWLGFHLLICKGCTNCREQMHFVRAAVRQQTDEFRRLDIEDPPRP